MAKAGKGDTVTVHYTGRLRDGRVFDSTRERGPMQLTIGGGDTLVDFEEALIGMAPGEAKSLEISCSRAYGRRLRNLERALRPDLVPTGAKVKPGQRLRIELEGSSPSVVEVLSVSRGQVVVDMNHPLAGQDLLFEVELLEIL